MKQEWRIHRQFVEHTDGQQRWDLAYQCLLRWAKVIEPQSLSIRTQQEANDESCYLCASIDPAAGRYPDH
jgi:hypothetical protein